MLSTAGRAQYAPAAGEEGSTAIHKDSSIFAGWANNCSLERGYVKISDTSFTYEGNNRPTLGEAIDATEKANGGIVSLGDGGMAVLSFEKPIANGDGPDFAVFENGFPAQEAPYHYFLELGFVEVSSDGEIFVRFPSYSETDVSTQVTTFDQLNPEKVYNLAGKYEVFYGTPFDLEDIRDSSGIDIQSISFVRIVDVVGIVHPSYARYDATGNAINDPWPTPFASCGFDLDALGVIHFRDELSMPLDYNKHETIKLYPNPVQAGEILRVDITDFSSSVLIHSIRLFDNSGRLVLSKSGINGQDTDLSIPASLSSGLYLLRVDTGNSVHIIKIMIGGMR